MAFWKPDYRFRTFAGANASFLSGIGVCGIVLDIDNTLAPYEHAQPSEPVRTWLSSLYAAGIRAAFVSNNEPGRVALFNETLGLPAFCNAGKPFGRGVRAAMRAMGTKKENTLLMGDQIFTDLLAARFCGIRCILVEPIRDRRDFLTRLKRRMERPILKNVKFSDATEETEPGASGQNGERQ